MVSEQKKSKREEDSIPAAASEGAAALRAFYARESGSFAGLREGIELLLKVQRREVEVSGDKLILQHNPQRIRSVAAKLEPKNLAARPCFLCPQNRPSDQEVLVLSDEYAALCNPFPIFEEHFTLVHKNHTGQTMHGQAEGFLRLCRTVGSDFAVFFNGARAGASAPDHLHFQSCPRDSLPLMRKLRPGLPAVGFAGLEYPCLGGSDIKDLGRRIERALTILDSSRTDGSELFNLIGHYDAKGFTLVLIPRSKHRPSRFFDGGDYQLMLSPAAVEMAGIIVLPRQEDFEQLGSDELSSVLKEVYVPRDELERLTNALHG